MLPAIVILAGIRALAGASLFEKFIYQLCLRARLSNSTCWL